MAHNVTSGTVKLSQDIETLINNRLGSDIKFIVGGDTTALQEKSKAAYDSSATITIYAHSNILCCRSRYFATMLDEKNQWKESSNGVIYKPNISPNTFQDVLRYIYTGNIPANISENIIELIAAAEEMELEELSIECQTQLIRMTEISLNNENNDKGEKYKTLKESTESIESTESTESRLSFDEAVCTLIIPALKLASSHNLSHFFEQIITTMLPHMTAIVTSLKSYTALIDGVSSQALAKIFASDGLAMTEHKVWDFALSWGCHHTNLNKTEVEACLKDEEEEVAEEEEEEEEKEEEEEGDDDVDDVGPSDEMVTSSDDNSEEHNSDCPSVSTTQLKQLKSTLAPLLPNIRFSLLEPEDYADMGYILNYFLSRHRSSKLQRFFIKPNYTKQLDVPRVDILGQKVPSNIIVESKTQKLLRKYVFETGGIIGCSSLEKLKFDLLFRASEHGFRSSTFHQHCDFKGPTLTIVRSKDGHLFGGVKFDHWHSSGDDSSSNILNFLFALADGRHRGDSTIFKLTAHPGRSTRRYLLTSNLGPTFGNSGSGYDLSIADCANKNKKSHSNLSHSCNESKASKYALAGTENFSVANYEVFAISKK